MHTPIRLLLVGIVVGGLLGAVSFADQPLDNPTPPILADPDGKTLQHDQPSPVPPPAPRLVDYAYDGCEYGDPTNPDCGEDQFEFTVHRNILSARHYNATYNCCLDDILVEFQLEGDVIRLVETELLTQPCYCLCCYTVSSRVVDLAPGVYTVRYYWFDDEPGSGWQVHEGQIVVPVPNVQPHFVWQDYSGCIDQGGGGSWPCEEDDQVTLGVAHQALYIFHENVTYNCCLDAITMSLTMDGNRLYISEEEVLTQPCYCICCYNAAGIVAGLPPGEYVVEYCWYDYETYDERCHVEVVQIP